MSSAATTADTTAPPPSGRTPRKTAPASWIGSALEHCDVAVHGTAAVLVLNHLFSPAETPPGEIDALHTSRPETAELRALDARGQDTGEQDTGGQGAAEPAASGAGR